MEQVIPDTTYKQINSLFHNDGDGKFIEATRVAGNGFAVPYAGRGAAFADFDNDGNVDMVVGNNGDPPLLLHNGGGTGNHFVSFKLVGKKSNRDAMGARVRLRRRYLADPRDRRRRQLSFAKRPARPFRTRARDPRRAGGGAWPGGQTQVFEDLEVDLFLTVTEGSDRVSPEIARTVRR